jgi:hypothetical protein
MANDSAKDLNYCCMSNVHHPTYFCGDGPERKSRYVTSWEKSAQTVVVQL